MPASLSDDPLSKEEAEATPANANRLDRIPPDGGAKAWACVAGSFLLQFCSFGYVNA